MERGVRKVFIEKQEAQKFSRIAIGENLQVVLYKQNRTTMTTKNNHSDERGKRWES